GGEPPEVPLGDVLGEVPLFREIQRVLLSGTGPVNWELARQVGIAVASWGVEDPRPTEQDRVGLAETVRAAELSVADFTGLPAPPDVATVEARSEERRVGKERRSWGGPAHGKKKIYGVRRG